MFGEGLEKASMRKDQNLLQGQIWTMDHCLSTSAVYGTKYYISNTAIWVTDRICIHPSSTHSQCVSMSTYSSQNLYKRIKLPHLVE